MNKQGVEHKEISLQAAERQEWDCKRENLGMEHLGWNTWKN